MNYTIKIFICLLILMFPSVCFSDDSTINLTDIDWNIDKESAKKDKQIVNDKMDGGIVLNDKKYGRDSLITYQFDKDGDLIAYHEGFGKFKDKEECAAFANKILDALSNKYNNVDSVEDLYSYYKGNNDSRYKGLVISASAQKWQRLFNDDNINVLFKNECAQNSRVLLVRYERKDWLDKSVNSGKKISDDSEWYISEDQSKLDNKKKVYISKKSVDTLPNAIGTPKHGSFWMRCLDNKTEVFIVWPSFIGLGDKKIKYRIDDNIINTDTWTLSTDGDAVFANKPIKFIDSLRGAKRFIIQLDSHNNVKEELEFDLTGIDNYIDKIAECCNWSKKK